MGCCLPRLAKPDDVLNPNDGTLCFRTISGGLKARKDNVQQSWPGKLFRTVIKLKLKYRFTYLCSYNQIQIIQMTDSSNISFNSIKIIFPSNNLVEPFSEINFIKWFNKNCFVEPFNEI